MSEEQLPIKRANRRETDAFYILCTGLDALLEAEDELESRAKLIPGGWRDLRLARTKTAHIVRTMLDTFDPDKRKTIKRNMQYLRIKTVFAPEASRDPEQILMTIEDVAVLIHAATQECKVRMCPSGECSRCELGKAIDRASYVTRGDRAWWEVFEQVSRKNVDEVAEG